MEKAPLSAVRTVLMDVYPLRPGLAEGSEGLHTVNTVISRIQNAIISQSGDDL